MSDLIPIGASVSFRFPVSGNVYRVTIIEQLPPKKKGDVERYRVRTVACDCYAFRDELTP